MVGGARTVLGAAAARGRIVVSASDALSAGEVFVVGRDEPLTDFGAELAAGAQLRPLQELTATAPDGYPVHGWLVTPPGAGPHPVLLVVHGGPHAAYTRCSTRPRSTPARATPSCSGIRVAPRVTASSMVG